MAAPQPPVWDARALTYQRTLLASLRTRVLTPDTCAATPRDAVVRAAYEGRAAEAELDLFESAALLADPDVAVLHFESFLWTTCKEAYRVMPTVTPLTRLMVPARYGGAPLLQLVAGFCRLDVLWQWRCEGVLCDVTRRALAHFLRRPRVAPRTELERLCACAVGIEAAAAEEGAEEERLRSLADVREALAGDEVAHAMATSALGVMWVQVLGARVREGSRV